MDETPISHLATHHDRICEPETLLEPLVRELLSRHAEGDRAPRFAAADALVSICLERGIAPSALTGMVLRAGRALGAIEGLQPLVDEAAVQVAAALEQARRARRQSFISFLVHEIKNPLNTMLNALWLLREKGSDAAQADRFLQLAERAVKRLEARTADVRNLDEDLVNTPPGWEAHRHLAQPTPH